MKQFCSLLVSMLVSASASAGGNDYVSFFNFKGISVDLSVRSYERERYLLGNVDTPNTAWITTLPQKEKGRISIFGTMDSHVGGFDMKTRMYRFSDQFGIGSIKENFVNHGIGFTYRPKEDVTTAGTFFRDHAPGGKGVMFGIRYVFF